MSEKEIEIILRDDKLIFRDYDDGGPYWKPIAELSAKRLGILCETVKREWNRRQRTKAVGCGEPK